MNFLAFWITAMVIVSSASTEEELPSEQQLLGETEDAEGRTCYDCHGGDNTHHVSSGQEHGTSQVQQYQHGDKGDLSWLWGFGGVGAALSVLPILAVNIVGVVLLAIILKHLVSGYDQGPAAPIYQAVPYASYQGYEGGAANAVGGGGGGGAYGGGAGGGYRKRAVDEGRNLADHSTLQFLTGVIGDAIHKYSNIDVEE